jgi:glutamate---cysteine ligase / carboxylate-amine ligase
MAARASGSSGRFGSSDSPPGTCAPAGAGAEAGTGTGTGTGTEVAAEAEAGVSLGVEEEFLLVEASSGLSAPGAESVLAEAAHGPALPAGARLQRELLASQVEFTSGVCTRLGELAVQLNSGRARLARAAQRSGLALLSTGTPVRAGTAGQLTPGVRYEQVADIYAGIVADYEACGCHVHVGVPDRETAVAVVNHLRPWLPSLLALSVNSPFWQGRDTGYGSWRMVLQSRFPGSGVPPYFSSAAAHRAQVERLVECGALADARQSFWLARPSPCLPTVELRAADAAATVEEAVLQAALSRGLVRTALAALSEGREAPCVPEQTAAAAVWSAARHGLAGPGIDLRHERRAPAAALVHRLLEHVTPALEETGDAACVRRLLTDVESRGTGAERQRAAAARGLDAVVAHIAEETAEETAGRPADASLPTHSRSTARSPCRSPSTSSCSSTSTCSCPSTSSCPCSCPHEEPRPLPYAETVNAPYRRKP